MKISPIALLLPLVLFNLAITRAQQTPPETTRAAFERWARRTPSFATGDLLYGRLGASPTAPADETEGQLRQFLAQPHAPDELRELARHSNPRVRTLALGALFEREDARLLPSIAAARRDTAATFDDKPEPVSRPILPGNPMISSGIDPRPKPQTVGEIASKMVDFYLQRAGCGAKNWDDYEKLHRNRAWSAGEFAVKLERAARGISPLQVETAPALQKVRAEIEALPRAERNWLLLALWEPKSLAPGASDWASEAEVVAAARELGAPLLLRMLEGQTVSADPDLRVCPDESPFWRNMKVFTLRHATELLEPAMADALLRAQARDRDEALWAQAAAELQPQRAATILKAALPRFDKPYQNWQRGALMATLWRLRGEPETDTILDWLWAETPDWNASPAGAGGVFLGELESAPAAPTKRLVARLIDDKRLENWPKSSLVPLARLINEWAGETIFEPRPLYGFAPQGDVAALALKRDFIAQARAARTLWEQ